MRQSPAAAEVFRGRALDPNSASEGYRRGEAEEDAAERQGAGADAGKDLTNEQTNGRVDEDSETPGSRPPIKLTEPSLPKGGKPEGEYEPVPPGDRGIPFRRQNETADYLASLGYKIRMLKARPNGNGYGIASDSNPDFLIEDYPFDCYSPRGGNTITVLDTLLSKTKRQSDRIVMNLYDYQGSIEELHTYLLDNKPPRLTELLVVFDGKLDRWIP